MFSNISISSQRDIAHREGAFFYGSGDLES